MNNSDKRFYIGRLIAYSHNSTLFMSELEDRRKVAKLIPTRLFKYCKIKSYTYDVLKNQHVYLSTSEKLNDPFDLITPISNPKELETYIEYIKSALSRKQIAKNILLNIKKSKCLNDVFSVIDKILTHEYTSYSDIIEKLYSFNTFTQDEVNYIYNIANNFYDVIKEVCLDRHNNELFQKMLNDFEGFGVCSLSKAKNTKPMWSHYGDCYAGICIEYEIQKTNLDLINRLYPVIYEKQSYDIFEKSLIKFTIGLLSRSLTNGKNIKGYSAIVEEFCSKDVNWSYEREWRILGKENTFYKGLKIKAVYLGYNVNEYKEKRIRKIANEIGFEVYKMESPRITGRLIFSK